VPKPDKSNLHVDRQMSLLMPDMLNAIYTKWLTAIYTKWLSAKNTDLKRNTTYLHYVHTFVCRYGVLYYSHVPRV